MEALKSLAVISAILFLPLYYLWTRGHKKTFIAFLGTFISLSLGVIVSIFQGNGIAVVASIAFVPLCFGFYFVFKHREKIFDFLRNTKKEYSISETIGWCIPIAIAFTIDVKYISYVFIAYIASCFFMNDFKGTFFHRVKFLLGCAFLFWVFVVIMYILGHVSSRFY